MTLTSTPTGVEAACTRCGVHVEQVRMLHGVNSAGRYLVGTLVWRSLDRGFASTLCGHDPDGEYHTAGGSFVQPIASDAPTR